MEGREEGRADRAFLIVRARERERERERESDRVTKLKPLADQLASWSDSYMDDLISSQ